MNLLLDTHILIWALLQTDRLSQEVRAYLENPENRIFYSVLSVWEVAIKCKTRKTPMAFSEEDILKICKEAGYTELPLNDDHIRYLRNLQRKEGTQPHKDPFDMMLICQAAVTEDMSLLTHDHLLEGYQDVPVISV